MSLLICESVIAESATPLVDACETKQWDVAAVRLAGETDLQATQPDGMTALHWAVFHRHRPTVSLLLARGAKAGAETDYGVSPLSIACEAGNADLVTQLLNSGADPRQQLPTSATVLMIAARTGVPAVTKALLDAGAEVDGNDQRGQTALMWAAAAGHADVVGQLLDAGANAETKSRFGFTAMFFAARNGHAAVCERLLDAGVDVNDTIRPKNTSGRSPRARMSALLFAVESGHFELALRLVERGADPNDQRSGYAPLHALTWVRRANKGDNVNGDPEPRGSGAVTGLEFARRLVAAGADVNLRLKRGKGGKAVLTPKGCTPFVMASKTADLPYMRTLLDAGADPTVPNADGCTALMAASGIGVVSLTEEDPGTEAECIDAVRFLASLGLDVNAKDDNGETAMHGAAYRNYPLLVEQLDELGADPEAWNVENKHGWTPSDVAAGKRPGSFKPSPPTVAALERVLKRRNEKTRSARPSAEQDLDGTN